ncbi:hypothetical protein PROFUN_01823 [Planoprotostelium fungivorum]|uniref:F-box/WD repeat-containing protein 7-like n=1 Tax=Planoprotostelium fungivorum TaxID=1890364 RepID=A0A2P6NYR7_9EUKA|nr:hypothetical protein PROFUN_01823 [Planoprotostelium fungivorum]
METQEQITDLEDRSTCWTCFEVFQDPITFSCSHTLCKSCAVRMTMNKRACPFCNQALDLPLPPVNKDVLSLVNRFRAVQADMDTSKLTYEQQPQSEFLSLPRDNLIEIILNLSISDIVKMSTVCRQLKSITDENFLWRQLCQNRFPFSALGKYGKSWKHCFIGQSKLNTSWNTGRAGDFKMTAYRGHTGDITTFKMYKKNIVTGGTDKELRVWRQGTEDPVYTLKGHSASVNCLDFNESRIMSGAAELIVWDVENGKMLHKMEQGGIIPCLSFGESTVTTASDGTLCVYDLRTGGEVKRYAPQVGLPNKIYCRSNEIILSGARGVRLYDLRKNHSLAVRDYDIANTGFVSSGGDNIYLSTGNDIATIDITKPGVDRWNLMGHWNLPGLMQLDGDLLATAHSAVQVYNVKTKTLVHNISMDNSVVNGLCMRNNRIVAGCSDLSIKIYDASNAKKLYYLRGGSRVVRSGHLGIQGISGVQLSAGSIIASIGDLMRVYDFDTYHAE